MRDFEFELKKMRRRMRTVNCLFHVTRNNPRTTYYFYHRLIQIAGGYAKWENANPAMKAAWESARLHFDQMYGLVKAWNKTLTTVPEKKEAADDPTKAVIDTLQKENRVLILTTAKLRAEREAVEAEKALELAKNGTGTEAVPVCPMQQFAKDTENIHITFRKKGE